MPASEHHQARSKLKSASSNASVISSFVFSFRYILKMQYSCFIQFHSPVSSRTLRSTSPLRRLSKRRCGIPFNASTMQLTESTTPTAAEDQLDSSITAASALEEQVLRAKLVRRRQIRRAGQSIFGIMACTGGALSASVFEWPTTVLAAIPAWIPEPAFALLLAASAFYRLELGRDGVVYISRRLPWRRHVVADLNKFIEVRPSPGKGNGAFARRTIAKGTFLGCYEGEMMDTAAFLTRYPIGVRYGEYAMKIDSQYVCDGRRLVVDEGDGFNPAWMNHSGVSTMVNVIRVWRRRERKVMFYTRREVLVGEELCFDYGRAYWIGREHVALP